MWAMGTEGSACLDRGWAYRRDPRRGSRASEKLLHLLLAAKQVFECYFRQHLIQRFLDCSPENAERAVYSMGTRGLQSCVAIAEFRAEQLAAEQFDHVSDHDLLGRPCKSIAAGLPANTFHKAAHAEQAHQLGHVGDG